MKEVALQAAALVTELTSLGPKDAAAYTAVMNAYKLSADTPDAMTARKAAIDQALLGAAEVPLETARACVKVLDLAVAVAERGNTNAVSDAGALSWLMRPTMCRNSSGGWRCCPPPNPPPRCACTAPSTSTSASYFARRLPAFTSGV